LENVSLPMIWSHVIGQKRLKKQLEYLFSSSQVPHAQLFTGLSGYGGLPLAIEFALGLLEYESSDPRPSELGKISQHADLHFVYPVVKKSNEKHVYAQDYSSEWSTFLDRQPYGNYTSWFDAIEVGNKQGIISVAEIEKLHHKMYLKAFYGKRKVCILWGLEKMNAQAANAFLKLLEEPPEQTFFLLLAEEVELVLPTLLSRCQQLVLGPIEEEALKLALPETTPNPNQLVTQAEGDYGRLLLMLDQSENKEREMLLISGLRNAFKAKGNKAVVLELMEWASQLASLGREEQKAFLSYGIQFFRDSFLTNYPVNDLVHFRSETGFELSKFAPYIHSGNISELISLFEKTHYHILRNGSAKMLFADLALKLTRLINLPDKARS